MDVIIIGLMDGGPYASNCF